MLYHKTLKKNVEVQKSVNVEKPDEVPQNSEGNVEVPESLQTQFHKRNNKRKVTEIDTEI